MKIKLTNSYFVFDLDDTIYKEVDYKISGINQERSIDVMITRLRQKIENDPKNPKYLQTMRGSGYVLWIE